MNQVSDQLAAALRLEIEEYGSLLGLFDEQQRMLFERNPDRVLELNFEIEARTVLLVEARRSREQWVAKAAVSVGQSPDSTLRSVVGYLASEVRPLFEALMREVNVLVVRLRQVSRHNRLLLQRAIQSHEEMVRALAPERFVQTYGPAGRVGSALSRSAAALDVAG